MQTTLAPSHPLTATTLAPSTRADENPALVYVAGLSSPASRTTMADALNRIAAIVSPGDDARTIPWAALRYQHTAAIRSQLIQRYAPATCNKMLAALRGTLRAAWQLGLMSAEEYHRAAAVGTVRGVTLPAGRSVTYGELMALVNTCQDDPTPAGPRDGAMIALLWACGLRRAEIVALDLASYSPDTGELTVQGKGRKERIAWAPDGARAAMNDWLHARGDHPGPLFHPITRQGIVVASRLTTQAVYNVLRKRADEAHVAPFSPHDLRRTFVSSLLDAGVDIATVARMAGHANVQTTARYDRRAEEIKRNAAAKLYFPWQR